MFKSLDEIDRLYSDHADSLRMWGGEADIQGVLDERDALMAQFMIENDL